MYTFYMSQDEFTKLFQYVTRIEKKLDVLAEGVATKEELNRLTNAVDAYAKQSETYMQEMLALGNKVDRLEQWILKVAEATGVKLTAS